MAVYTQVSDRDLAGFLARFDIGAPIACTPIAEGIENSNYLVETVGPITRPGHGTDKYILTLYEARVAAADLPFYLDLMKHLSGCGITCPLPVADRNGETLHTLCGRPAAIFTFLAGDWPRSPTPDQCRETGRALARLHAAGRSFDGTRPNDLSVPAWRELFEPLRRSADTVRPGLTAFIGEELSALERQWPVGLPGGIIHADLFPDNVFFRDGKLSGLIDFYFACTDFLAYDIAICLNAWCFDADGTFDRRKAQALIEGYEDGRALLPEESAALPVLARGAAMRFLLTRLHDWFHTPKDALTRRKDPLEFIRRIEFHRSVPDSTAYGVG